MSKETAEKILELVWVVTMALACPIFVPFAHDLFWTREADNAENTD